MIESFACKETEKIFHRDFSKRLPTNIQQAAYRKLKMLHRSSTIQDLRVPPTGWRRYQVGAKVNTAFGSTSNGVSASNGWMAMLETSKS